MEILVNYRNYREIIKKNSPKLKIDQQNILGPLWLFPVVTWFHRYLSQFSGK